MLLLVCVSESGLDTIELKKIELQRKIKLVLLLFATKIGKDRGVEHNQEIPGTRRLREECNISGSWITTSARGAHLLWLIVFHSNYPEMEHIYIIIPSN